MVEMPSEADVHCSPETFFDLIVARAQGLRRQAPRPPGTV